MAVRIPLITDFDGRGIRRAMTEFKQLEGAGAKAQFALQKAFLPATAALAGLAVAGGKTVSAASDLNEAISFSGKVFGNASKEIEKFASTAAKNLGQSKRQAIEAATSFGGIGKTAGLSGKELTDFSTKLVTLASDMASAKNTSPEEAITALGAALRGESEPIRKYNILLDDFSLRQEAVKLKLTDTTKNALTPQQKVLAANSLIMKNSIDMQGDYIDTSDGLANSQRQLTSSMEDLQASIGQALLPVVEAVLPLLKGMADWATKNSATFLAVGAAIGVLATAIVAANVGLKIYNGFALITTGLNKLLGKSFTTLQVSLGVIGATLAAAASVYGILTLRKKDNTKATENLADALLLEKNAREQSVQEIIKSDKNVKKAITALSKMGLTLDDLTEYVQNNTGALAVSTEELDRTREAAGVSGSEFMRLRQVMDGLRDAFEKTKRAAELYNSVTSNGASYANINFDKMRRTLGIIKDESGGTAKGIDKIAEATKKLRDGFKNAATAAQDGLKKAIEMRDAFAQSIGDAIRNTVNFGSIRGEIVAAGAELANLVKEGVDQNSDAFKQAAANAGKSFMTRLGETVAKAQEFGNKLRQLMQAGLSQQAIAQIAQSGAEAGTAIADELLAGGAATIAQANSLVAAAEQAAIETGTLAGATYYNEGVVLAQQLTQGITDIISKYKIKLSSAGLTEKQLKRLRNRFAVDVDFVMQNVPALANGGIVTRGPTLALIGEAGPEAVVPLSKGGAMGNVTINVNGGDPNAVVDALRTYMRQNGSVPIRVSNLY